MLNGTRLAAVDLGSNSFRLEIVRLDHGHFERTEYLKETIRQGAGMDADRNLSLQAMQRGWECLARFGERLSGFEPAQVRAVATQTLREARNREAFLVRANQVLGFPIDVISGREEARLIYQGVAKLLPRSSERRLVVDIGGRSTELIVGRGGKSRDVIERESPLAGLESAEHRDVDVRPVTHLLQREALLVTELTEPSPHSFIDRFWSRVCLHGKKSCSPWCLPSRSMS